jgi:uncharacterized protein
MKISGTATMHAPPRQVWAALKNPAVLSAAIPGCRLLELTGPDTYRFTLLAGVAAIRDIYSGDIALTEQHEPSSFVLTASGAGGTGRACTSVLIRLVPGGTGYTALSYDADAQVGGLIAYAGPALLATIARRLVGDFFAAVDGALAGAAPGPLDGS